jgi:hypothetical protein
VDIRFCFKDADTLRAKVVGFYRKIDDYIELGYIYNSRAQRQYDSFVNLLLRPARAMVSKAPVSMDEPR